MKQFVECLIYTLNIFNNFNILITVNIKFILQITWSEDEESKYIDFLKSKGNVVRNMLCEWLKTLENMQV